MMREILFRGKREDNGEWITGALFQSEGWKPLICNSVLASTPTDESAMCVACSVQPDTVGEFTGMKDKNGKMIFEGDIVKPRGSVCYGMGIVEVVTYENGGFSPFSLHGWECPADGEMSEVIGNIYDNPELLPSKHSSEQSITSPVHKPKNRTFIRFDKKTGREVISVIRETQEERSESEKNDDQKYCCRHDNDC